MKLALPTPSASHIKATVEEKKTQKIMATPCFQKHEYRLTFKSPKINNLL
jgi:hypothetical protein